MDSLGLTDSGVHEYGPGITAKEALGKIDPKQKDNEYEEVLDENRVEPGETFSFKYNRGRRICERRE
eukprot:9401333-Karenia_brevis.AAC.1